MHLYIEKILFDLDAGFTTSFSDEFWERLDSLVGVRTHVNLESWKINKNFTDRRCTNETDSTATTEDR